MWAPFMEEWEQSKRNNIRKHKLILDTKYGHYEISKNAVSKYQAIMYQGDPIEIYPNLLINPAAVLRAELVIEDYND